MATQLTAPPKLYIGMDIHKKSWSVHMKTDISDHKTLTIPSDCNVLYDYVKKHFQDHEVSLTYEAGCCGFSASRYFMNVGWNVLVVNPADVPTCKQIKRQCTQKKSKYNSNNDFRAKKSSRAIKTKPPTGIYFFV